MEIVYYYTQTEKIIGNVPLNFRMTKLDLLGNGTADIITKYYFDNNIAG